MRRVFLPLVCLALIFSFSAQSATTLSKGVTIGNWLAEDEDTYTQTTRYTLEDFQNIKDLGCDHVRISVYFFTRNNVAPDYNISPIYMELLDKAVSWAEQVGLKVVIVNAGDEIVDGTMEAVQERVAANWKNVASHFASKGDVVAYEIFDAPGDLISAENWNTVATAIIAAIREVDQTHSIIVGPVNFYDYKELANLSKFDDDNVIYTFDFFEPLQFTHQGVSYNDTTFNTFDVPFPYNDGTMPAMSDLDAGTAAEAEYNAYSTEGNVDWVKAQLDLALQFGQNNSVPMYCASLGAQTGTNYSYTYETGYYVPDSDRAGWISAVREHLEANNAGWALSTYAGSFGFFYDYDYDPDLWLAQSVYPYDVNQTICTALGFTSPEIGFYEPEPLTEGFVFFDEEPHPMTQVGWWLGDGWPDFFWTDYPAVGNKCLGIFYPGQYNAVDFFMPLYQDLSLLAEDGYVLDFFIRCDLEEAHIQARFEDTNEDLEEHPWRFNYHVDNTVVPFDGEWQRVTIPLTDMEDQGAWDPDDRTWYNGGQGLWDWSRMQTFQFVSETAPQPDAEIFIDRVRIVHPSAVEDKGVSFPNTVQLAANYPNPFNPTTTIEYNLPSHSNVELAVYNIRGELVKTLINNSQPAGLHRVAWDGTNMSNTQSPSGVYFYQLSTEETQITRRMVLMR